MFQKIYLNGNYTIIQLMNIIKEYLHKIVLNHVQQNNDCNVDQMNIISKEKSTTLTF